MTGRRRPTSGERDALDAARDADHARLMARLNRLAPSEVPCLAGPLSVTRAWLSDVEAEARAAAAACSPCPLRGTCRAYALTWPGEAGVYGGLTPAERQRAARTNPEG